MQLGELAWFNAIYKGISVAFLGFLVKLNRDKCQPFLKDLLRLSYILYKS